ncbi:hypothetical protein ACFL2O_11780, partial [Thermodesulfobacteriota bacterium]
MNRKEKLLLWAARGGMEISWLYAWAAFSMNAILDRPFPMPEAVGTFILAAILTILMRGRGWLVIFLLVTHLIGFSLALSRVIYAFTDQLYPYLSREWAVAFMNKTRDPVEWIILTIILCFVILFWVSGVLLARRSDAYYKVCNRFDIGLAAFLGLFLLKLLMSVKGGMEVRDPMSEFLVLPFFMFSLLAIGIVNSGGSVKRDFLSGFRGVGLTMSFSVIALGFAMASVTLFLPYLTIAAEAGYGALKTAVGPLSPFFMAVLRLISSPYRNTRSQPSQSGEGNKFEAATPSDQGWLTVLMGNIFVWIIIILVGVIVILVLSVGTWYLLRWLLSRSYRGREVRPERYSISPLFKRFWEISSLVWQWIAGKVKGYCNGVQLFGAVVRWGRR